MRPLLLALVFVVGALPCIADEPYQVTIPGKGWAFKISLPPLSQYEAQDSGQGFRFMGASEAEGIIISFYVEEATDPDSESCRTDYWATGSKNPMIAKETVSLLEIGGYPSVAYVIEGEYQEQPVKSQNVNVYIAHAGNCIDLHLSRFPYMEGADKRLAEIASSATFLSLN